MQRGQAVNVKYSPYIMFRSARTEKTLLSRMPLLLQLNKLIFSLNKFNEKEQLPGDGQSSFFIRKISMFIYALPQSVSAPFPYFCGSPDGLWQQPVAGTHARSPYSHPKANRSALITTHRCSSDRYLPPATVYSSLPPTSWLLYRKYSIYSPAVRRRRKPGPYSLPNRGMGTFTLSLVNILMPLRASASATACGVLTTIALSAPKFAPRSGECHSFGRKVNRK